LAIGWSVQWRVEDEATAMMRGRRRRMFRRRRRRRQRFTSLLVAAGALALAASSAAVVALSAARDNAPLTGGVGPVHIHALAVNPRDEALFVASHTGLYRIGRGENTATRVSEPRQDTKGFTVVSADRFLGSGHPNVRDNLPPRLGLIESRDGGESWQAISLRGRADFHVLRARAQQIVGYDSSDGRVMVSRDGGRSWRARLFAGALVDIAVHPSRPNMLVATTRTELLRSRDGGRTWGAVSETTGLLAWPRRDRLYLLAPDGRVWWSPDLGRRWQPRGEIGGPPAALVAYTERRLFAALEGGVIKQSTDGGSSWRLLALTA
jgi:hypothetical protein